MCDTVRMQGLRGCEDMVATDHRPRVGAERRGRMRSRLVQGALQVFAERGIDASVIDDLIRTAGVSRGTFYNYFRTNEELLVAVSGALSDELMRLVDPVVREERDPATRIATGIRLFLELFRANPHLCAFMARGGMRVLSGNNLVSDYLPRDLHDGMAAGRFSIGSVGLGFDLVAGTVLAAAYRLLQEEVHQDYSAHLVTAVMVALGLNPSEAAAIADRPVPVLHLPSDSILLSMTSAPD